ncbi:hypothetical protein KVF89_22485 [Nocardioides carbamazepini]|uniref:hypothetical protein n=1 Tax=Nocardioides carbamazepini TaxID=2854259 RepID=UPI00214A4CBF|nr:hypothetical protein [Nocardioides carbamazepini]MCR1785325.1 hypothetical protein [Nocardioides carbamazepini]
MALHGLIQVNGYEVGRWAAQRIVTGPDGMNTYQCGVVWTPEGEQRLYTASNNPHTQRAEFTVTHDYRDGSVALAAKVLATALEVHPAEDQHRTEQEADCG